ncbi:hypothetical protein BH24ACI2_BH24ACI2_02030 [soil metagenome]|jgi:excisionase family DNA binding protein|nr:helix-turn-helix domain-containing protein [Acidobacteriota bacterium]
MSLISTKEASKKLGVSILRVQQLIWAKRLPAQRIGRDYVINESDLQLVKERKNGRPKRATGDNKINESEKPFKTIFDVVPELAGSLDSGLGDLSTNKKYLEGLGRDKNINR